MKSNNNLKNGIMTSDFVLKAYTYAFACFDEYDNFNTDNVINSYFDYLFK